MNVQGVERGRSERDNPPVLLPPEGSKIERLFVAMIGFTFRPTETESSAANLWVPVCEVSSSRPDGRCQDGSGGRHPISELNACETPESYLVKVCILSRNWSTNSTSRVAPITITPTEVFLYPRKVVCRLLFSPFSPLQLCQ